MKNITKFLVFAMAALALLVGCKKPSSQNSIIEFKLVSPSVIGVIDQSSKTITVIVPNGTDVTELVPQITVSDKAIVSPASGVAQNFSTPVTYKVTAEDGSEAVYTVTVSIGDLPFYTVSVSAYPSAGGTASGGGSYQQGNSCTVTATANIGYTFVKWTENGEQISTSASYSFTVGGDRTLVANFITNGGGGGGGTTEGMYVGLIGFNDVLKTKTTSLLNNTTEDDFLDFIESLTMDDNTALYHATNTALDWLQNATFPADLINVSLLTFTDGLDNASLMLNGNFNTQAEFLDAVNNRILNDKVQGKSINAYSIGLKGNNVNDEEDFQQKLKKLASQDDNAFLYDNMDVVIQRFKEIANQLYNEITIVNTNVKIPGGYDNNTTIRLTFDNVGDANGSTCYIQATFSRENGKGKLSNINYYGLQSTSDNSIFSNSQEGASYWYTFSDLKTSGDDGQPMSNLENMKLWIYNSSTMTWRPEDEFTPSNYTNVSVTQKSAVAILVLDCTTSLGSEDFRKMKNAASEFITTLNDNSGGGGGGNGGGNQYHTISVVASEGGSVSGGGDYDFGESCTVTATAYSGYAFSNWTENGDVVSTNANYTFTVNADRTLVAHFQAQPQVPTGAINGLFSVSASQQVYFSQGNLQYKASTNTWRFATNQWDYVGNANSNISQTYSNWIDLFGWGTSGWNCGNTYYRPWDSNNSDGSLYGPPGQYNLTGSYANSDWGRYNAISNGGNQANQWRTLTHEEWGYVFNTRTTSSGIRYAKAQVNNVNGVILLPDNWSSSTYSLSSTNQSGANFTSNVISSSQWTVLENAGAVFLPAAGYRDGTFVGRVGSDGHYWSASCYNASGAWIVYFNSSYLGTDNFNIRCFGRSVRLVRSAQ